MKLPAPSGSVVENVPTVAPAVAALWPSEALDRPRAVGASLTLPMVMPTVAEASSVLPPVSSYTPTSSV